jgi:hypothetical protein
MLYGKLYEIQSLAKYTTGLGHIDVDLMLETIYIPLPSTAIQQEVLGMLQAMEEERTALQQMAIKAEERATYILQGYLQSV